MAAGAARAPGAALRNAAERQDRGAPDGQVRGARLLELLPLRQPVKRRGAVEARDGGPGFARHCLRARGGAAGRRRPRDGSDDLREPRDRGARRAARDRARARGSPGDPAGRRRRHRDRPSDVRRARSRDRNAPRDRGSVLLRLDRSCRRLLLSRLLEDVRDVALRERGRGRLLELPAGQGTVRRVHLGAAFR